MADSAVASATYSVTCISNLNGRGSPSGPGGAQVTVSWSAQTNATTYNVLRSSTTGGPYTLIGNTNVTGYRDGGDGLLANTTYYYVVQPLQGSTEICQSNQAAIAIP
jgi:fibronectin type 3 domain-containing protein